DLQEIQPLLFNACDVALGCVRIAAAAVRGLAFNRDRMLSTASSGYMNAMAAATYLVGKGVPFRTAHEQVGKAVRYCIETGCELQDLDLPDIQQFAPEAAGDFYAALTPEAVLDCHDVFGGTARHRVAAAVKSARAKLDRVSEAAHAHA
ncbi:MAG TPA: argininosuccinate lyase, partial [Terriglobales bacterium]